MEPIQIRPQIEPKALAKTNEGVASRYSRARNGAVSRQAQARGGRSEEIQAERRNEARSRDSEKNRSTRRGSRSGKRGARGKSNQAQRASAQGPQDLAQNQAAESGQFAAKLEQSSTKKAAAVETQGQQKTQSKGTDSEMSAFATPVTLGGPAKQASALMSKAAGALAKAGGITQRGPELGAVADLSGKTAEPSKKQAVSNAREAAPTPEREQASDVLKQVRVHLSPETRSATVNLKPAELGRVSIRIVVDGDQVQAIVRAESPEALEALDQYMPELQAALGDHGFQEADIDLSLGFEGEESASSVDPQGEEVSPEKIHRLFGSSEAVDYFA